MSKSKCYQKLKTNCYLYIEFAGTNTGLGEIQLLRSWSEKRGEAV